MSAILQQHFWAIFWFMAIVPIMLACVIRDAMVGIAEAIGKHLDLSGNEMPPKSDVEVVREAMGCDCASSSRTAES